MGKISRESQLAGEVPEYPRSVRLAGIIWIVIGCLTLGSALSGSILTTAMGAENQKPAGGPCFSWFAILVGAVFIHVGIQSVRGSARDTLGNAIGSLIFGVWNVGLGVVVVVLSAHLEADNPEILAILGGVYALCGAGLLTAGVLALVGRSGYNAWRFEQKLIGESRDAMD